MKLRNILDEIRGIHRYATADDIRGVFGDYHNVLHWLALFLVGDVKMADACIVDACNIAPTRGPVFHEWLVHWAARATIRSALHTQHAQIAQLVPEYERTAPVHENLSPLSAECVRLLIQNSELIHARLDVLCRFVLVLHGIGKDSWGEVAVQLGISPTAAERAYRVAFDTLRLLQRESASMQTLRPSGHVTMRVHWRPSD